MVFSELYRPHPAACDFQAVATDNARAFAAGAIGFSYSPSTGITSTRFGVRAYDLTTPAVLWNREIGTGVENRAEAVLVGPTYLYAGGHLETAFGGASFRVEALNPATGAQIWKNDLEPDNTYGWIATVPRARALRKRLGGGRRGPGREHAPVHGASL